MHFLKIKNTNGKKKVLFATKTESIILSIYTIYIVAHSGLQAAYFMSLISLLRISYTSFLKVDVHIYRKYASPRFKTTRTTTMSTII